MKDHIEELSGIIYRHLSELYQKDGRSLPCKNRESVKDGIITEFTKCIKEKIVQPIKIDREGAIKTVSDAFLKKGHFNGYDEMMPFLVDTLISTGHITK